MLQLKPLEKIISSLYKCIRDCLSIRDFSQSVNTEMTTRDSAGIS